MADKWPGLALALVGPREGRVELTGLRSQDLAGAPSRLQLRAPLRDASDGQVLLPLKDA
ncbi:MAG TPA: hypothetical protein VFQ44_04565 [Streptosporangiaceae bacterium]|nr:hypothetical protein [Streptosporangiaceae bacterium]